MISAVHNTHVRHANMRKKFGKLCNLVRIGDYFDQILDPRTPDRIEILIKKHFL